MSGKACLGAIVLALVVAAACSSFTGENDVSSTPDAGAEPDATPIPVTDGGGPILDAGPEPVTAISPYRDGGLTFPEKIVWTLSTVDDGIIHYTTDGTTPTAASKSASGAVVLQDLPDGTVISWSVGAHTEVHSFTVQIDGPDGGSAHAGGQIFQNFRFDTTTAPITKVKRGVASINAHAGARVWNGNGCPGCIDVLTMGIGNPQTCVGGGLAGLYPGGTVQEGVFQIAVPPDPGVYSIRIGSAQVYTCEQALAAGLTDVQIGILIVEP